jgi:drug/metabolite transporter (DMT)-like permease
LNAHERSAANLKGALLMVASGFGFTIAATLVKLLGTTGISAFQTIFVRAFIGLAIVMPWLWHARINPWRSSHLKIHLARAGFGGLAVTLGYYAFTVMPLADVTAISFTIPLFVTVLAAFLLRETVRRARWIATAVGFVGVLIIARPGGHGVDPQALFALAMALCVAFSVILLKRFPERESQLSMLFFFLVASGAMAAVPAVDGWVMPDPGQWGMLAGVGLMGVGSQALIIRAYRVGEANFVAPFDYVKLLFAGLLGFVFFTEVPDIYTGIGAAIIVASSLYTARSEARARGN